MPLRPFPLQLSIGTDIVHVNRVRSILGKAEGNPQHVNRLFRRVFTPLEQQDFRTRYGQVQEIPQTQLDIVSRHLAGRWAAKEATIKAVTWRRLSLHDIVITRTQTDGRLRAVILDQATARNKPLNAPEHRMQDQNLFSSQQHEDPMPSEEVNTPSSPPDVRANATSDGSDDFTNYADQIHKANSSQQSITDKDTATDSPSDSELSRDISGQIVKISISHDGEYATAVCLAAEEPGEGDVGGEAGARQELL